MICLDCLRGSVVDRKATPSVSKCEVCEDVRLCLSAKHIALFVPYIPLVFVDLFETESINDRNQCQACKGKRVMLLMCGQCHEKKCGHLMKPSSPNCLTCTASAS